ncbi:hypothetical protein BJQ89_00575 [Arthrobacter sp. ES1]|nr:hypothetical protein [Arthrobacter sp. ES1]
MAKTGRAMQMIASTRTAASAKSPAAALWESMACCFQPLSQAVPRIRGRVTTMVTRLKASRGTVTSTHTVTTARAQGLRSCASGSVLRQGIKANRVGLIRWNRSGTPVASARMWYPSKRTMGSNCRTICRI